MNTTSWSIIRNVCVSASHTGLISAKIVFWLWIWVGITLAQKNPRQLYSVKIWSVKDGLPQHTVNAITQTPDGYLWIATEGGLARFDGFTFRTFDRTDTPFLQSNRVRSLAVDKTGKLFIGMYENGIGYYHNGIFDHISKRSELPQGSVPSIAVDNNNVVWFVIARKGLFYYDGKQRIKKYDLGEKNNNSINQIFHVNDNGIYLRHDNVILLLKENKIYEIYSDKNLINGSIYRESENTIYISTNIHIIRIGEKIDKFRIIDTFYNLNRSNLIELDNNNIIVSSNNKYFVVNDKKKKLVNKSEIFPVNAAVLNSSFVDADGNRWFGSSTDGLVRVKPNPFQHYVVIDEYANDNSLAIYRSSSNMKWLSYMTDNLLIQNASKEILYNSKLFFNGDKSTVATYYSFLEHQGTTYLGSNAPGIYTYKSPQRMTLIPFPDGQYRWVKSLYMHDNHVWAGTSNGLFKLNGKKLEWINNGSPALNSIDVAYMKTTKDGVLWISSGQGIFSYNGKSWKQWDKNLLNSRNYYRGIFEFDATYLIIGSYGNGLFILNRNTGEILNLSKAEGLIDNVASFLHVDSRNNLWSTGNIGLSMLRLSDLRSFIEKMTSKVEPVLYTELDGAPTNEYQGGYQNSGFAIEKDLIVVPSLKGFVQVDLNKLQSNIPPKNVLIESISYNNANIYPSNKIELEYSENRLEIAYTAPYLSSNTQPVFRYQLVGYDEDWIEAGSNRIVSYTNLKPGTYTFKVMAGLRGGIWGQDIDSMQIRILPPLYLTWWFQSVVAIVLLITLIYLFYVLYNKLKTRQNNHLLLIIEAQEFERRRIAADLHDSVGQMLSSVKMRLNFANSTSIDGLQTKEVVNESQQIIDRIATEIRSISYNLVPSSLKKFGLITAMEEQIELLKLRNSTQIYFYQSVQRSFYDSKMELGLFRIFQELLNNSIKHAQAKEINIQLIEHESELNLIVEDDGIGFHKESNSLSYKGSGLSNISSRVAIMGGVVHFDSKPGNGTTVTVTIPLV